MIKGFHIFLLLDLTGVHNYNFLNLFIYKSGLIITRSNFDFN